MRYMSKNICRLIPTDVKQMSKVFKQWHETHIRWVSPRSYVSTPPFTSRVSPGLHILFTPLEDTPNDALCEQLKLFESEIVCSAENATAIKLPTLSGRFSMSSSLQHWAYLESIQYFLQNTMRKLNIETFERLVSDYRDTSSLSYLDIDYDTISRAVVLSFGWADAPDPKGWSETVFRYPRDSTVEIGVLIHEANSDPEDIQFGGFLTVLGEDERPSMINQNHECGYKLTVLEEATQFQTPTRHYPLLTPSSSVKVPPKSHPLTYTTSFSRPTGLHPTLVISFPKKYLTPPNPTCKLHTHLTLPSYLFIDKYQFSDPLFLASKNLKSLRSLAGATDLEAPNWVVKEWGSAALFQLAHPDPAPSTESQKHASQQSSSSETWNISIPLHLRYMPAAPASHARVPVPWPVVFWACRAEEGAKMAANPFDRTNLGYEALFGPKTRFMHVQPRADGGQLMEWIDVPVLDTRGARWVESGTVGIVLISFLGLCWMLFGRMEEGKTKSAAIRKTQ